MGIYVLHDDDDDDDDDNDDGTAELPMVTTLMTDYRDLSDRSFVRSPMTEELR